MNLHIENEFMQSIRNIWAWVLLLLVVVTIVVGQH